MSLTLLRPIFWWAIFLARPPRDAAFEVLEYLPAANEWEARCRMARKQETRPQDYTAVEAQTRICTACHKGFLQLHDCPAGGLCGRCRKTPQPSEK